MYNGAVTSTTLPSCLDRAHSVPAVHTTLYNAETSGHVYERDVSGSQEDVIDDARDASEGERDRRRATG